MRLLLAWTQAINLTGIREPAAVALGHVVDSLTAVPVLRSRGVTRLLDLGSGGGFPGLPLAAALPAERALLVDSIAKKVGFLRTVIDATGLGGHGSPRRRSAPRRSPATRATGRRGRRSSPAPSRRSAELVEVGLPLVAPGGVLVAWKREPFDAELAGAAPALAALRRGPGRGRSIPGSPGWSATGWSSSSAADRIDPAFPRDAAERKRRPL